MTKKAEKTEVVPNIEQARKLVKNELDRLKVAQLAEQALNDLDEAIKYEKKVSANNKKLKEETAQFEKAHKEALKNLTDVQVKAEKIISDAKVEAKALVSQQEKKNKDRADQLAAEKKKAKEDLAKLKEQIADAERARDAAFKERDTATEQAERARAGLKKALGQLD